MITIRHSNERGPADHGWLQSRHTFLEEPLEFLQIWIEPNVVGVEPGYQQKQFEARQGLQLIASPDANEDSLMIHQDTCLYQLRLNAGQSVSHSLEPGRTVYVHVVSGSISVNGEHLSEGDGATVKADDVVELTGNENSEALVFDLP